MNNETIGTHLKQKENENTVIIRKQADRSAFVCVSGTVVIVETVQ